MLVNAVTATVSQGPFWDSGYTATSPCDQVKPVINSFCNSTIILPYKYNNCELMNFKAVFATVVATQVRCS